MTRQFQFVFAFVLLALMAPSASAQLPATGTPPFGSFGGGPDVVNLGNLNVHIAIPVRHKPGRGTNFDYDLTYDSSVWTWATINGTKTWQPISSASPAGWQGLLPAGQSYIGYSMNYSSGQCTNNGSTWYAWTNTSYGPFLYYDQNGVTHHFSVGWSYITNDGAGICGPPVGYQPSSAPQSSLAADGSGFTMYVTPVSNGSASPYVVDKNGTTINAPINPPRSGGASSTADRNGNQITSANGVYTDTLNQTALSVVASGNTNLSYTAPSGATASYAVSYKTYTVRTNFGCSSPTVSEYNSNGTIQSSLVDKVTLPDGSYYQFLYETTPLDTHTPHHVTGRIASVQLPSGGTISYTYTGGPNLTGYGNTGIVCADGSAAGLTRTTPDTGSNSWTYTRSQVSGSHWQTKITTPPDPQNQNSAGDDTVIDFQEDASSTGNFYETQRQSYQGPSPGTLLQTVTTCYNGNTSACATAAVASPLSQRNVGTQLGASGLQDLHIFKYDSAANLTEQDDYAYANGTPTTLLRKVLISYASFGVCDIFGQPAQITTQDGSGNIKSQTTFTYDQGTLSSLSGTPQHITPGCLSFGLTGRANLNTVASLVQGSTTLNKTFTYYDTGMAKTATDVNNGLTTFNYLDSSTTCGNAFPTSVTEAVSGLSRSTTWNCTGGVQLTSTDENGKTTTTAYSDADFWRPASVTDPLGNQQTYYYQPNPTYPTFEVAWFMNFNNGSSQTSDLQYFDSLGRVYVDQKEQNPNSSTLDSVSYAYDTNGRLYSVSMPCAIGWAGTCSTPKTTKTYDALNRPLQTTDAGGGYLKYSYSQNDVLVTIGPTPTGSAENLKQRQLEYDSLGRLVSVCEITTSAPSGNCGQQTSASGYLTNYSYDALGNLTGVTQNAQPGGTAQSRSYNFDGLSRLTSETNPESGTTTYAYDSATGCTGTFNGDLVKRVDAVTNTVCFAYDLLHRNTSITYSGSYASVTPSKYFVYDTATVNGVAMANAKTRLAEAYTTGPVPFQDSDFEASSSLPPPGWMANVATLSYETSSPYAGARSLKIAATALYGGAQSSQQAGVPGKQYTISGYTKSDGVCYSDIQLVFLDASHTYLGGAQAFGGTQTTWAFVTATATAPTGTAFISVSLQNQTAGGAGVCEFDNISASTNAATTDLGFSYTARGETSDAYELTPHSGGYYHVAQTYWPHGAPNLLSATAAGASIAGLPNITYGGTIGSTVGLDGEGRITQVTAASGWNPVTATAYNTASLPTQVTYGTNGGGDSDILAYDSNTLRMNSYQFTVGSQSVTGTLGWNANGSLGTLGISDPFNTANTQIFSSSADGLSRITKADCRTIWGQTFSYDPFGNIIKNKISSNSTAFIPTYQSSPVTNRVASVNGVSATYDANGNSLNDTFRSYTWDADGNSVTIGSATLTFDALDRMVEQTTGSTNSEIVYGPGGGKLALMNGTSLIKAFVPLTGGATAVYTSSGLAAYRHTDHLGSSRLSSTPTNTVYSDTAYSAFGEPYAQSGALDPSFTGQNQDTTAGLYDFLFREQDPNQGRWASPDLAGLAAVDITNPQSWNRYAYVLNSPANLIDPFGLDCTGINIWNVSYEGGGSTFPCPLDNGQGGGFPPSDMGPSNPALAGVCAAQYQSCVTLPNGNIIGVVGSNWGYLFYQGPLTIGTEITTTWYWGRVTWDPAIGYQSYQLGSGGGVSSQDRVRACMEAADKRAVQIAMNGVKGSDKAMAQILPSADWVGTFVLAKIFQQGLIGGVTAGTVAVGAGIGILAKATYFTGKAALITLSSDIRAAWQGMGCVGN